MFKSLILFLFLLPVLLVRLLFRLKGMSLEWSVSIILPLTIANLSTT